MHKTFVAAVVFSQFTWANGAQSQVTAETEPIQQEEISCPSVLNDEFNNYQPVRHQGASFWSVWQSEVTVGPIP
jgi:hypothetical protein